jgi:polar amino acid transport system substrate-binding protein
LSTVNNNFRVHIMKKIVAIGMFLFMACTQLLAGEVIALAIGDWEPYTSSTNPKGKLLEKVVTEAFKLEGIDVKYEYYPWKRSKQDVEDGLSIGTFPWNRTPEREALFVFNKVSLIKDEGVYFHLKSTPFKWNTLDDLKNYAVGVTLGLKQVEIYKKNGIRASVVATEDQIFKMMLSNRIEVYQTTKAVGYTAINKLFPPDQAKLFTHHPKPVETDDFYVMFSKTNPKSQAYADRLDAGLKKLMASGGYKKILAEYGL